MKHTAGPWSVENWGTVITNGNDAVAHVWAIHRPDDITENERQANARLIAAAPEMLSLLERAYHVFECDTERKRELLTEIATIIAT